MELTQEQYDGLPDYGKAGFAESDGKFLPVKDVVLKGTLDNLDKEKQELLKESKTVKKRKKKKFVLRVSQH